MKSFLPPMRALQAFEAFGRLGSVSGAAQELGVTPGAISQQIKTLEDQLGIALILKDGRRAALAPQARDYHEFVAQGFEKLRQAQHFLAQQKTKTDLKISGLPTLLHKWLNPALHRFQTDSSDVAVRLEATHAEPDPQLMDQMFRFTYGGAASRYPHSRQLFTDVSFPVCSPDFLERYPEARDPAALAQLPLIEIDWGPAYATISGWSDWFAFEGLGDTNPKPVAAHSLSGLALEAAIRGQGAVLAQLSFAALDLEMGRLVRLSPKALPMPEPYFVCWGQSTMDRAGARDFLNWIMAESRELRETRIV